jgi:ABC-type hemin transport system ATPase subunit
MTYGCIEDLKFAIEVFDQGGNLIEVLARLHDLDAAQAAYNACRLKYSDKLIMLCQGGRILRRSDRMAPKPSSVLEREPLNRQHRSIPDSPQ